MHVQTSRLKLRPLTLADAEFIIELVNDPAWIRFIGDRNIHDPKAAEAYIEKCLTMYRNHGVGSLAVELKSTGTPIGICGLLQREQYADLDLGFALLERFRGHGYAREAASAMLRVGHDNLQRRRVLALTDPGNAASIALLESLGFVFESSTARPDGVSGTNIYAHAARVAEGSGID
jgi:[ribosomal protein S5]-alanine N-acetyltransferase